MFRPTGPAGVAACACGRPLHRIGRAWLAIRPQARCAPDPGAPPRPVAFTSAFWWRTTWPRGHVHMGEHGPPSEATGTSREPLLGTAAAVPRPRNARPCPARCSERGWGTPGPPSSEGLGSARRGRRSRQRGWRRPLIDLLAYRSPGCVVIARAAKHSHPLKHGLAWSAARWAFMQV